MMRALPIVLILAVAAQGPPAQQPPLTLNGTGLIAGQVVDPGTGKPVPEAIVTIWVPLAEDNGPRVMSDAQGRFVFVNVPAGKYRFEAQKAGYYRGYYGQRIAGSSTTSVLELSTGEIVTDLVVPTWKCAVIAGTVTDEAGQPVVGVRVQVLRKSISLGAVELTAYGPLIGNTLTDDQGAYRIANIPPGEYAVAVPTTVTTFPAEIMSEIEDRTNPISSEAYFALGDRPGSLGSPLSQQIRDAVVLTSSTSAVPPPATETGLIAVYRTTLAPGTSLPSEAAIVTVGSGDERTLDIGLRPTRAVRVSGRLIGPEGPMSHARLTLIATGPWLTALTSGVGSAGTTASALTDAAGRFTFLGVPDGDYVATMYTSNQSGALSASEPVSVRGADVADVTVTVRRATRLTGHFELRSGQAPENQMQGVGGAYLYAWGFPLEVGHGQFLLAPRGQDLRFQTQAPAGRYALTLGAPRDLWCTSVMRAGRDVSDEVFVVGTEDIAVTVICGDAATHLRGTVRKDDGTVDADAAIVAFPVEREYWSGRNIRVRRFQDTFADKAGTFTLVNLPPGDYFVVAMPIAKSELWQDPKFLETLTRSATRVTLGQGESRTADLRTVQIK